FVVRIIPIFSISKEVFLFDLEIDPQLQIKIPINNIFSEFFILHTTCLCMISLRVSATNLANTNRIENSQGFS
ncbi:MAG: hypothetical protein WBM42_17535, partial [Eudoraea sp.]|uniref:hypothetical protein n=1 Tax=Eudoraea sp. TaxID=1979955 RepID=UPI003C778DC3